MEVSRTYQNHAFNKVTYSTLTGILTCSIWTHHLKEFEVLRSYRAECGANTTSKTPGSQPHLAARFGAGIQGGDAFDLLAPYNLTTVSGTNSVRRYEEPDFFCWGANR